MFCDLTIDSLGRITHLNDPSSNYYVNLFLIYYKAYFLALVFKAPNFGQIEYSLIIKNYKVTAFNNITNLLPGGFYIFRPLVDIAAAWVPILFLLFAFLWQSAAGFR